MPTCRHGMVRTRRQRRRGDFPCPFCYGRHGGGAHASAAGTGERVRVWIWPRLWMRHIVNIFEQVKLLWALRGAYNDAARIAAKENPMKSIFASKTFWFNVLAALVQVVSSAGLIVAIPQPYGALAQSAVNVLLRLVTVEPAVVKLP